MKYKNHLFCSICIVAICFFLAACARSNQLTNESSNQALSESDQPSSDTMEAFPSHTVKATESMEPNQTMPASTSVQPSEEIRTTEATENETAPGQESNSDSLMPEIEIPVATENATQEETRTAAVESEKEQASSVDDETSAAFTETNNESETSEEEQATVSTNEKGDIVLPEL